MKRTNGSKLAAQPECSKHRPKAVPKMTTAERVRASLLAAPRPRG